jgi:hypothetical protein
LFNIVIVSNSRRINLIPLFAEELVFLKTTTTMLGYVTFGIVAWLVITHAGGGK